MGSPLSPLLAEIFMNKLETEHVMSQKNPYFKHIVYYHRYVDDVLIAWKGTDRQLTSFITYMNKIHEKIKFTLEKEIDQSLNFLDLTITRNNEKHDFKIYRKPTYTDTTIHATSNHTKSHKHAAFHAMIHRLVNTPLNKQNYNQELKTIKIIAQNNGYEPKLINNILRKHEQKQTKKLLYAANKKEKYYYKSLPYFGEISEKIARTIEKQNEKTKIAYRTPLNLGKLLNNTKDKIDKSKKSGVYKLECDQCDEIYIGETGRQFETRYREHIKNNQQKSNFGQHLANTGHKLKDEHTFKILHIEDNIRKRKILESIEINKHKINHTLMNEQIDLQINSPIVKLFTQPS